MLVELIGKKLIQLCIGEYQLQFHFEQSISISVECSISGNGVPLRPADLVELVGSRVSEVSGNLGEKLFLRFETGLEIVFGGNSSGGFESYQIWVGNELLVGY